ncbi:phosphate butyryltransferase [Mechercharimyces sp. CAU 1602]|uniref:phosphate butyryltransferase n=1 Tax=Mechercharimyces sp. CAU 1602 TaxID=2973933 RepID=UPI0021623F3A|nr:phosphate butyryltransferase [Mechercharimyces sp. CAU 1602]MCS1350803.1 phosphate butyryltransferase [Mechercharimyces sp. CAU 1602]
MTPLRHFDQVINSVKANEPVTIAVAAAADHHVMEAVIDAHQQGIARFILIDDQEKMERIAAHHSFSLTDVEVMHQPELTQTARDAVRAVHDRKANIVMKGMIQTADFLRAVLHKEYGLAKGGVLSHIAAFQIPGYDRLVLVTDSGLNIAPTLKEKVQIIENAISLSHSIGVREPKVALLGAIELVNPNMPATMDAAVLTQMNRRGQIRGALIDGPLALDNAISLAAAEQKGIESEVAGMADVLVVPNIESGNILYKSLSYFAHSQIGSLVVGASAPVVLTSRSDGHQNKLRSIALAVLQARQQLSK